MQIRQIHLTLRLLSVQKPSSTPSFILPRVAGEEEVGGLNSLNILNVLNFV